MTKTIAIIPARGGSKRLPGKNLLPLDGIPLLVHSIQYAQKHRHILDGIVVSTEDEAIGKVAKNHGVEVLWRPSHLATDEAPTIAVLQDALQQMGPKVAQVILLQPTNPLRPENLLEEAFTVFVEKQLDSLMTVTRNHQKFGKIINDKFVPYNYRLGQRSQDLEPLYFENGLLYIAKSHCIQEGSIVNENHFPFTVDHPFAYVDIDTEDDLRYAAFLLKNTHHT